MMVIMWQDKRGDLHDTEEAQVIKDLEIDMDDSLSYHDTLYGCDTSEIVEFVFKHKDSFDRLLKEREKEGSTDGN